MKIVFETGGQNPYIAATTEKMLTVFQREDKSNLFTVVYGLQVEDKLTYGQCCFRLGAAILHMQCCEGIASNEGR